MAERPGLYVRLEVGLSWPRHVHKQRSISYTSSALRERQTQTQCDPKPDPKNAAETSAAARATQYSTDHYLRHVYDYANTGGYLPNDAHRQESRKQQASTGNVPLATSAVGNAHQQLPIATGRGAQGRPSLSPIATVSSPPNRQYHAYQPTTHAPRRSRSLSSCERQPLKASSTPAEQPWDWDPEPMGSTALPSQPTRAVSSPNVHNPLPPAPARFELYGDDAQWSPGPDPAAFSAVESQQRGLAEHRAKALSPTSRQEHGRTVEMQSLATALMTVDNGFEDQWWYQGPRNFNLAGDLISPAALQEMYEQDAAAALGFDLGPPPATPSLHPTFASTPSSGLVDLVSPVSDDSNTFCYTVQSASPIGQT